jgi:hypothetical protein
MVPATAHKMRAGCECEGRAARKRPSTTQPQENTSVEEDVKGAGATRLAAARCCCEVWGCHNAPVRHRTQTHLCGRLAGLHQVEEWTPDAKVGSCAHLHSSFFFCALTPSICAHFALIFCSAPQHDVWHHMQTS